MGAGAVAAELQRGAVPLMVASLTRHAADVTKALSAVSATCIQVLSPGPSSAAGKQLRPLRNLRLGRCQAHRLKYITRGSGALRWAVRCCCYCAALLRMRRACAVAPCGGRCGVVATVQHRYACEGLA